MIIKLVLIGKLEVTRSQIKALLNDKDIYIAGEFKCGASALSSIESIDPDIVIMTLESDESDVFSISERIYLNKPRSAVILITKSMDVNILHRAMNSGIRHVIPWNENGKTLVENIKSIYNTESSRCMALSGSQSLEHASKVVTVLGTKGGCGKTTVAVNLAVNLARQRKKVALIDLNLEYGDANIFLNMETNDTFYELVQGYSDFDIDTIRNYMIAHSSGVNVLCAPRSPEYAEFITKKHVEKLLSVIRPYYDFIIVDVAACFNESTLLAIDSSALILMVTGLDIATLRNSKISLKVLESLKQKHKVMIVINRESKGTITVNDVKKILQCPIAAVIPSDWKTVGSALNTGVPFVLNIKKSKAASAISDLTNIVMGNKGALEAEEA